MFQIPTNLKRFIVFVFLLVFSFQAYEVRASHAAGGEIIYEWLQGSTYKITFKFYRDCSGIAAPANLALCYTNTCTNTTLTTILYPLSVLPDGSPNGGPVSLGCPGVGTTCTNTSSAVPGYREWWYTANVTLPSACSLWRFSVGISARNGSVNLGGGGPTGDFYSEATLNNVIAPGNSSPYFSVKPVPSICINQPYTYNNGGVDPNSDSLAFELIMPQSPSGGCTNPYALSFASATPSFNLVNNPFQTNNTFVLSASTGQMTFTPAVTGSNTLTVRVNEYRNGVFIGSVMRDIQVQVINCAVTAPIANTVSTTITGGTMVNGRIEACAKVPLSFCFDLKSNDTAAIIVASDNSAAATPGATVTYTGQKTDSVRGCFSWTPNTLDTGLRIFTVTAKDSTCVSPGVSVAQTFVFPVYIWPITDIIKDTTICYGDSVSLLAVGGNAFTWTVLPGGAPLSTLSCTTCRQPYAKPLITTQYVVQNTGIQYCSKNRDTVTVAVLDIRNDTLIANATTNICQGDTLKLFSSTAPAGYGYRWTGPAGYNSLIQNPQIISAQPMASGVYYLSSSKLGCYSRPDTVAVQVTAKPAISSISSNTPVCEQSTLNLFANSATGTSYTWSGPNSFSSAVQNPSISNTPIAAAGIYSVYTSLNGCKSNTVTTTVVVNPKPVIGSVSYTGTTACGASDGSITLSGLDINKNYTLNYFKNGVAQAPSIRNSGSTGMIVIANLNAALYSRITISLLGCASDTTLPLYLPDPKPPVANSSNNSPVCEGSSFSIYAFADSAGVTWQWTGPNGFSSTLPVVTFNNVLPNQSGNYILTATKNNCISAPDTTYVTVYPTPPSPNAVSNSPLCSGNTIVLQADSMLNGYYSWTGPNGYTDTLRVSKISNGQPIHSGVYTVVATVNGCISPASSTTVVVNPTPAPVIGSYTISNTTTCFGSDGSITLGGMLVSTFFTVTYKKNGVTQPAVGYVTSPTGFITIPSLTAGIYSEIKITATTGCSSDPLPDLKVSDPPPPVISLSAKNNPVTCLGANGSIIVGGMTSSNIYSVSYTKNSVVQPGFLATADGLGRIIIPALGSGAYHITTTINNCVSNVLGPITLTDPNPPVVTASNNTPICQGSTVAFTGTSDSSGVTWSWTGPWGFASSLQNPTIPSGIPSQSGVYTLIASKNNCFSQPASTVVTIKPTPGTPTVSNSGPVCEGDVLQLYVSTLPNATFAWIGPGGFATTTQSPVFMPANTSHSGTYTVVVTVDGCVSSPASTIAVVNAKPAAPAVANTLISYCQGQQATPLVATGINLQWYDTAIAGTPLPSAPIPSTIVPGTYYYYVSQIVSNCESQRARIRVVVQPRSAMPATTDTLQYCQFASTKALYAAGNNILWYTQATGGAGVSAAPVPSSGIAGVYNWYVTQTDMFGCESNRRKVTVIIHPALKPHIVATSNEVCVGDEILIEDTTTYISKTKFVWTFGNATVGSGDTSGPYSIKWQQAGLWTVHLNVADSFCNVNDSIKIQVHPLPSGQIEMPPYACINEKVVVKTMADAASTMNFATDGGVLTTVEQNKVYNIQWNTIGTKVVALVVKSQYGCISPAYFDTIGIYEKPDVKIESIDKNTICIGDTVSVKASYSSDLLYTWSGEAIYNIRDMNRVLASKRTTGYLYIKAENIYGCYSTDSTYISTENCCDVSIPDAFSPNGDGKNDLFRIISKGNQDVKQFIIVNRWGQKVFQTTNQSAGWDGRLNGVPQDMGTYTYYLRYTCTDGRTLEKKGDLVLVR
jgi:gliding motility-associated-like protein